MQRCPQCHTENEDGLNFCTECGTALQPLPPMPQRNAGAPGFALKNLPGWVWGALALVLSLAAGAYLLLYGPGGVYSSAYGERTYGNWILAVTDEDRTLYSINVLTGEKYKIEENAHGFILPDEKSLVYVAIGRNETRDVFLCDIRGENKKNIAAGLSDLAGFDFSPDGSVLAITWGDNASGYNVDVYSTRSGRKLGSPVSNLRGVEDFNVSSVSANGRYVIYNYEYMVDVKSGETTTISAERKKKFFFGLLDGSRMYDSEYNVLSVDVIPNKQDMRTLLWYNPEEGSVSSVFEAEEIDLYPSVHGDEVAFNYTTTIELPGLWTSTTQQITGAAIINLKTGKIEKILAHDGLYAQMYEKLPLPVEIKEMLMDNPENVGRIVDFDGKHVLLVQELPESESVLVYTRGWQSHLYPIAEVSRNPQWTFAPSAVGRYYYWGFGFNFFGFDSAVLLAKGERIVFVSGNDIYVSDTKGEDINLLLKDATIVFYQ